jgi:methyltransferase FkbM-like protein
VLSFGLGDDISFDEEISRRYGVDVCGFDPTTPSLDWIAVRGKPPNMRVFPIGIAKFDGRQKLSLEANDGRGNFSTKATGGMRCMRYSSMVAQLKLHRVEVLKLNVEGSEYDVIPGIVTSVVLPVQPLIEFHHSLHHIRVTETRRAVNIIRNAGFFLFAVSAGEQEMSLIRL